MSDDRASRPEDRGEERAREELALAERWLRRDPREPPQEQAMQVQFLKPPLPPPPPKGEKPKPKPEAKRIPRPDPTPTEPEPAGPVRVVLAPRS